MAKLNQHLSHFEQALRSLEALRNEEYSDILRDATIQRFAYTTELFWKSLKAWLLTHEGIVCYSPKKCIRMAASTGILDDSETEIALQMIDDRNLISHTYLEEIANHIYSRSDSYSKLMRDVLSRLNS